MWNLFWWDLLYVCGKTWSPDSILKDLGEVFGAEDICKELSYHSIYLNGLNLNVYTPSVRLTAEISENWLESKIEKYWKSKIDRNHAERKIDFFKIAESW